MDEKTKKAAVKVYKGLVQGLYNLRDRWSDEGGYEDWSEYEAVAKKWTEGKGAEFMYLTKRPFALYFKVLNEEFKVHVTAKGSSLTHQRRV